MTLSLEQIDDEVMAKAATSAKAKCALGKEGKRGLSSGQSVAHGKWPLTGSLHRTSVRSESGLDLVQLAKTAVRRRRRIELAYNHTLPIILLLIPQFVSAQCLKKEDFLLDPNAHRT